MALQTVDFTTLEQALAWKRSQESQEARGVRPGEQVILRIAGESRPQERRSKRHPLALAS